MRAEAGSEGVNLFMMIMGKECQFPVKLREKSVMFFPGKEKARELVSKYIRCV